MHKSKESPLDETALHFQHILKDNMKMIAGKEVTQNSSEITLTLLLQYYVY